jgi:hypothetical protein
MRSGRASASDHHAVVQLGAAARSNSMNAALVTWLVLRGLRWLCCLGLFAYGLHFFLYPESHLNQFGQLVFTTELGLFGLGTGAVFAGFLELMMREKAGVPRPKFGRLMPTRPQAGEPN